MRSAAVRSGSARETSRPVPIAVAFGGRCQPLNDFCRLQQLHLACHLFNSLSRYWCLTLTPVPPVTRTDIGLDLTRTDIGLYQTRTDIGLCQTLNRTDIGGPFLHDGAACFEKITSRVGTFDTFHGVAERSLGELAANARLPSPIPER